MLPIQIYETYPYPLHMVKCLGKQHDVTPSVLRPKQITKPYREHHVYVIIHVMEGVDNIFMTLDDQ